MQRLATGAMIRVTLPTDTTEPKTIYAIKEAGNEDWAVLQAALSKQKQSIIELGKDANDPEVTRRIREVMREAVSGLIGTIWNAFEEGDEVTEKAEIRRHLKELPPTPWDFLVSLVVGAISLTDHEVKS